MAAGEPALTGFDRAYRRLGERQARQLLDDVRQLAASAPSRPVSGRRPSSWPVCVHLVTAGLVVGGVVLVVATWFDAVGLVGGVVLRDRRPRGAAPPGAAARRATGCGPEEVPLLHELTDEIADASCRCRRCRRSCSAADFNIGYAASGLTQQRVLVIGLPFWSILDGPGADRRARPTSSVMRSAAIRRPPS